MKKNLLDLFRENADIEIRKMGLNHTNLSKKTPISQKTVNNVWNPKKPDYTPLFSTLVEIADGIKKPLWYLLCPKEDLGTMAPPAPVDHRFPDVELVWTIRTATDEVLTKRKIKLDENQFKELVQLVYEKIVITKDIDTVDMEIDKHLKLVSGF